MMLMELTEQAIYDIRALGDNEIVDACDVYEVWEKILGMAVGARRFGLGAAADDSVMVLLGWMCLGSSRSSGSSIGCTSLPFTVIR